MKVIKRARVRPQLRRLLLLAALVPIACDDGPTEPASADDAAALTDLVLSGAGAMQFPTIPGQTLRVDRDARCPDGGTLTHSGTSTMTEQGDTRVLDWDFTLGHEACALLLRGERVVIDGTMHVQGHMRVRPHANAATPPTLLEYEARQQGTTTTTHKGASRTCDIDITQRFDAASNTMRITGTSCGHAIDFTRPNHL